MSFEFWQIAEDRLRDGQNPVLLIVAESTGSSPGRAGFKMLVTDEGLHGSIGGGVMEVRLVERAKAISKKSEVPVETELLEQVHRRDAENASGMICSGRQTVICKKLGAGDLETVSLILNGCKRRQSIAFEISNLTFHMIDDTKNGVPICFERIGSSGFVYQEKLGEKQQLVVIGGGHCALALSELMSRLDFKITIFDDRPELNTIEKNRFAQQITIIDSYERIAEHVSSGANVYVVVMTLGYKFDEIVIRRLIGHQFRYFGVLGSRAKMTAMFRDLERDGLPKDRLAAIRTPIGLPINSHSPEEIAVSIAAEIIQVRNSWDRGKILPIDPSKTIE